MKPTALLCILFCFSPSLFAADKPKAVQTSESGITHSFATFGNGTAIIGEDSTVTAKWAFPSRDGFVQSDGSVLIAVTKSKDFPGGGVVHVDRDGKTLLSWKGTQTEVNSAQMLEGGNIMLTEAGPKPRLLEIDKTGKTIIEFPLQCQTSNHHMQTRMSRKLAGGNYLVPHLLDTVVKEYTKEGKVVWEYKTPADVKECWPFTAIRLENGNTLVACTHGNMVIEIDKDAKEVWRLTNADLPAPLLKDPCGIQRLANGNTVITSYGEGGVDAVKMLEVTREKKLVWTFKSGSAGGIHGMQILSTNGKPEPAAMK